MARQFLTPIDLAGNELRNAVIQNLATNPVSPTPGRLFYNTTLNTTVYYNGTAFINPLDRANHIGFVPAAQVSGLTAAVVLNSLSSFAGPTANIPMNGYTFTGVAIPTASGQVAEYSWVLGQVQSATAGIASRPPVRVVATTNITTTGTMTIDGVALNVGDRVLLTAQTTAPQNGVYTVAAAAWPRTVDYNQANELIAGATWLVTEGTQNTGSQWRQATTGALTLGTTPIGIVQFSVGGTYTPGNGLSLTTGSFAVKLPSNSGLISDTTGVYTDSTVVVRKFALTIGDGSSTTYTVTHNLNNKDAMVQVYQTAAPFGTVEVDVNRTDANNVSVVFAVAPVAGSYRVIVQG